MTELTYNGKQPGEIATEAEGIKDFNSVRFWTNEGKEIYAHELKMVVYQESPNYVLVKDSDFDHFWIDLLYVNVEDEIDTPCLAIERRVNFNNEATLHINIHTGEDTILQWTTSIGKFHEDFKLNFVKENQNVFRIEVLNPAGQDMTIQAIISNEGLKIDVYKEEGHFEDINLITQEDFDNSNDISLKPYILVLNDIEDEKASEKRVIEYAKNRLFNNPIDALDFISAEEARFLISEIVAEDFDNWNNTKNKGLNREDKKSLKGWLKLVYLDGVQQVQNAIENLTKVAFKNMSLDTAVKVVESYGEQVVEIKNLFSGEAKKAIILNISADVEILSSAMQYSDSIEPLTSVLKTKEIHISSFEETEKAVAQFIENQFGRPFESSCAEASPDLSSSLIYNYSSGDFMYQIFINVEHEGKKVVFPDYYPAVVETEFKLLNTGDKKYFAKEYKAGEYGIYDKANKLYADCFESIQEAQGWYDKNLENNKKLQSLNDEIFKTIEDEVESNCQYCKENKSNHFLCDSCGVGMCDECYESDREHNQHYHMPLENCEDTQIDLVKKVCQSDDPQYICETCMQKALSLTLKEFADHANEILKGTTLRAVIIETSELYGEDDDDVSEEDPYYMQPMYEGYLEDVGHEEEIDDSRTGRYCSLESVADELESFASDRKIGHISYELKKLVATRWKNKEELENHLNKTFFIQSNLVDVDESGLVQDYNLIGSVFEDYGFIDIYYLKIPFDNSGSGKTIYITEVNIKEK